MTEPLSIPIDSDTKSFLAAEAITGFVDSEAWQLGEIHKGIEDLDAGQTVSHEKVTTWLSPRGKAGERKVPR